MFSQLIRFGLTCTAVALFAVGCASTQAVPLAVTTASSPTSAPPVAPTATQAAPTTGSTQVPTTNGNSSGGAIRFVLVPEKSEARFRVREQLANVSLPNDAIGKTRDFTGTMVIKPDGTIVSPESKFVVNIGTLATDRSQRDNFIKRNVLQTDQYPTAVFGPTQATGLPTPLPQSGQVSFKLTGDLTIRNVTKPVTWDVTAQVQGNEVTGQATTTFKFEDFSLTQPRVPVVLSIEDHIGLELDLVLQRASS
jgi:polyisoprenoid-binding protein YceI